LADTDTATRFFISPADAYQPQRGNLTEQMRAEIAARRQKKAMPEDWNQVRSRFAPDSITAQHMDARHRAAD
jgi:hypothetical protein